MNENTVITTKTASGQIVGEFTPKVYRRAGLEHLLYGQFPMSDTLAGVPRILAYVGEESARRLLSAAAGNAVAFKPPVDTRNAAQRISDAEWPIRYPNRQSGKMPT